MTDNVIAIPLNQQQLELIDRTVAGGHASDRQSLLKRAIREYLERHTSLRATSTAPQTPASRA